jgi:hypothetical protein
MKVITDFFTSISEERAPGQILPKDLDSIIARFFLDVLKKIWEFNFRYIH